MGTKKVNTSGYHPQTDGLVEKFNSTLVNMLSKVVQKHARDWDRHLAYLLFAYRSTLQSSTKESPFFLLYGRDPRQPTATCLSHERTPYMVDIDDYRTQLTCGLSECWKIAAEQVKTAQLHQKKYYDRKSKQKEISVGDRVMIHTPHEATGKAWKLARAFHGPFRVLSVTPTNIDSEARLVDRPEQSPIFVSRSRVRRCYNELADVSWSVTLLSLTLERKQALRKSRNVHLRLQLLMEVDHSLDRKLRDLLPTLPLSHDYLFDFCDYFG